MADKDIRLILYRDKSAEFPNNFELCGYFLHKSKTPKALFIDTIQITNQWAAARKIKSNTK